MICEEFKISVAKVINNEFGQCDPIVKELLQDICNGKDPHLVGVDFKEYIKAHEEVDRVFMDKKEFCKRTMKTLAIVGHLSVDRTISEMCEKVWKIPSVDVPKPSQKPDNRVRSATNLLGMSS